MKRLIGAFVVGAILGFLAGLVAPPRERRSSGRGDERWDALGFKDERSRELSSQASEK